MSANRNLTSDFNDLIGTMLAKDPDRRPQTMEEFLRHLQTIRVFRVVPKPPSPEQADPTP